MHALDQLANLSNQEVHETIESLVICIQNNSQGLNRALSDLQIVS